MISAKKFQTERNHLSRRTDQSKRDVKHKNNSASTVGQNDEIQHKRKVRFCDPGNTGKHELYIPGKRVFDRATFNRLKDKAVVVTAEEQRMAAELRMANKERLKAECEIRKKELQAFDILKKKGSKLAKLDDDANKMKNYLLERAKQLRLDQEDEIKNCNSLILSTKCHAIRCAQVAEKELIQKEMKQEEHRMVELMEQQRLLAAKEFEKATEAERLKKKLEAMEIVKQMKENEIARELEAARIAEDAKIRTEAAIDAQLEEVKDYKEKLIKQSNMRREFLQLNDQLKDIKKIEKELEKLEILQIQEYDRKKNEREISFEEETKKQKLKKEKEIAKIQASQKASQDLHAAKDELNAIRVMDKVEREWRRKEHEQALKKIKENEELKEARRKQIEGQRECFANEIQREKEQFDKIIKLNVEDIEKTKEMERQAKMRIDEHRKNLLKQINEKELERIKEKKTFFQEGITYQEEKAARIKMLENTIQMKIENLKAHNLPEKYIHEIERQTKLK